MEKIRLSKISGDKLIPVISTKGNRTEKYIEGYSTNPLYPEKPIVGYPFQIYNSDFSFRTSPVKEILSGSTFRTENSTYEWRKL